MTEADAIANEKLNVELLGVVAADVPTSAAEEAGAPSAAAAAAVSTGAIKDMSAVNVAGEAAVIGHVGLKLEDLASGPTRNDHPLYTPVSTELESESGQGIWNVGNGAAADVATEEASLLHHTGARLAFRCRVSELRRWRIQLEHVKLHLHDGADGLGRSLGADGASRAFLFSLSYNFTSGSTDTTSNEQEWHAPSSQLRVSVPGTELDLEWDAVQGPVIAHNAGNATPPSRDGSEGSRDESPKPSPHGSGRRLGLLELHAKPGREPTAEPA